MLELVGGVLLSVLLLLLVGGVAYRAGRNSAGQHRAGRSGASGRDEAAPSSPGGLEVPVQAGVDASAAAGAVTEETPRPDAPLGLRVLLAEDNPVNQRVAELMLVKLGCEVQTVGDGRAAVAAVEVTAFDAVVMDVQMPGMDGLAATRAIRSQPGEDRQPYILAMSAGLAGEHRAECLEAGMDAYLTKPVRAASLRAALCEVVPRGRVDALSLESPEAEVLVSTPPRSSEPDPVAAAAGVIDPSAPTSGHPSSGETDAAIAHLDRDTGGDDEEPVPPSDQEPAVDVAVLYTLVAQLDPHDSGLRDILLGSYLDDGSAQIARLLLAAGNSDLATVATIAHTLRSTSALLGANHLAELLLSAEEATRHDAGRLPAIALQIDAEHARVATCLSGLRRQTAVAARR